MPEKEEQLLDFTAASRRLCCSITTIYKHYRSQNSPLKFVKVGVKKGYRVTKSSVEAMIIGNML